MVVWGLLLFSPTTAVAEEAAAKAGANACAVRPDGIAGDTDLLILAVPYVAAADALRGAGDLTGKTLVDITNPVTPDYSALALGFSTSAAEEIQKAAPTGRGISGFLRRGKRHRPGVGPREWQAVSLWPGVTGFASCNRPRGSRLSRPLATILRRAAGRQHVDAQRHQQQGNDPAKRSERQMAQHAVTERGPDHHPEGGHEQQRPECDEAAPLGRQVDWQTGPVHEQPNRRGRRDEGLLRHIEAQHRSRPDAALIAHQAAEPAGQEASDPRGALPPTHALDPSGQLGDAGQQHDDAEDDREAATRDPRVQQGPGQPAERAREAKPSRTR
jgi:hypothetical protein